MAFLDTPTSVRLSSDVHKKAQIILEKLPLLYESLAHLVRCAIIKVYNQEVLGQKPRELSPDEQKIARMEVE